MQQQQQQQQRQQQRRKIGIIDFNLEQIIYDFIKFYDDMQFL